MDKINTCDLTHLGPRCVRKGSLLGMVRHRAFGAQTHPVVTNSCDDEFLHDIVIVPGMQTTFMLSEFLSLHNGCLCTVFFNRFTSPLGMDVTPTSRKIQ